MKQHCQLKIGVIIKKILLWPSPWGSLRRKISGDQLPVTKHSVAESLLNQFPITVEESTKMHDGRDYQSRNSVIATLELSKQTLE